MLSLELNDCPKINSTVIKNKYFIFQGLDPNPNKGWGSYLPWPGGK